MNHDSDRGRGERRAKVKGRLVGLVMVAMSLSCPAQAAPDRLYEGTYVWGAEVNSFSPCGSGDKAFWVVGSEEAIDQLKAATERLIKKPYGGLYVRVTGGYAGPVSDEDGFAAQYDGLFEINKVWSIRKTSKTDCQKR